MVRERHRKRRPAGRRGLLFALLLALAVPSPGQDRPPVAAGSGRTLGPLEKSLLLPGWGQFSEKRYLEGFLFLAAETAALAGVLVNNHLGNENYAIYRKAETLDEAVRTRRLTEKFDVRRNQLLLAAAAVWAANLVDIALIVKKKGTNKESFSLRIGYGTNNQLGLTARCRF